jgi:integrase
MLNGRRRDCGLGTYPETSLAKARQLAEDCRRLVAAGVDPIENRNHTREALRAKAVKVPTFAECAKAYIAAHEPGWKNPTHRRQWRATLATHVFPTIGNTPVDVIDVAAVLRALTSFWQEKPETASRVRGRIELILDWAGVQGYRNGDNPARWRGHLQHALSPTAKLHPRVHFAALPYDQVGDLMAALREQSDIRAKALEFLVLTATRTGETLGGRWDEIDIDNKILVIPAQRMKGGREHRVPLSLRALQIVEEMATIRQSDYIFPGWKQGKPLSPTALRRILKRLGYDTTTHGLRSSFRDWCDECTNTPWEIAEGALAHIVGTTVQRSYRRTDALEKRRKLMEQWAVYCEQAPSAKVVPFRREMT